VGASAGRLCKFHHVICPHQMYCSVFIAKARGIVELCDATVNTSTSTSNLRCYGELTSAAWVTLSICSQTPRSVMAKSCAS
jgi:hypothetical protein